MSGDRVTVSGQRNINVALAERVNVLTEVNDALMTRLEKLEARMKNAETLLMQHHGKIS